MKADDVIVFTILCIL